MGFPAAGVVLLAIGVVALLATGAFLLGTLVDTGGLTSKGSNTVSKEHWLQTLR